MSLEEGQVVRITVETLSPTDITLEIMLHFWDGVPKGEIAEIECIILDRRPWFPERDWSWVDEDDGEVEDEET